MRKDYYLIAFNFAFLVNSHCDFSSQEMAENFKRSPHYNMGATDSSNSLTEDWTFQDLERFVSSVFIDSSTEEPRVSPATKTITNFLVDDKVNYFQQVHSNILMIKNSFLGIFEKTNKDIEEMICEITLHTQNRKKELQAQLLKIRKEKIEKWNRQLSICEDVLQDLKIFNSSQTFRDTYTLDQVLRSCRGSELDFIDSGAMTLEAENLSRVLSSIKTLGSISGGSTSGLLKLKSIAPKFFFGSSGTREGEFCRPWGVCSDATGRILVCDRSNHRIQIFNESGQFLIQFGKEGSRKGEFNRPSGIAVDSNCRIIVADKDNHRVQVFTYSGSHCLSFGKQGTRPGFFMYPWDVAVNKNCDIAVSDSKNHRVQLFTQEGILLNLFDAKKTGITNPRAGLRFLDSPRGLAFRPDGNLLVTDFNNHRVLLINRQFNEVTTFGCEGHGPGQFFRPQGITCDNSGKFAVSDCKNYRIQIFDARGNFQHFFGSQGNAPGQFDCPQGIAFHPNENIIVVDFNNNRIQVF